MAALTIRTAAVADAPLLASLRVALSRANGLDDPPLEADFRERSLTFFTAALAARTVLAWLAYAGDEIAGAAVLELRPTLPRPRARAPVVDGRVRNVIVLPAFRRRGVASALMHEVLEAAVRERCDRLSLGASEMAVPLYEKLGFEERRREMDIDLAAYARRPR
jgi:ribosomal protein S18 acetylase RimI-like enzyme